MKFIEDDYDWEPPHPINWDGLTPPNARIRGFITAFTIGFLAVAVWGLALWKLTELI